MSLLAPDSSYTVPEVAGYTIVEQLYLGSRTAIYRAIQTAQQRPVVIKVLPKDYPSFSELVQFRNQYAIATNLSIPGIVRPLSLEPFGNSYVLVMEDWGGIALSQFLEQQRTLPWLDGLSIALQLTEILHDLAEHRVVHKDIKPANILIQPESKQVKLIDFSIASLLPKEVQESQSPSTLEGTLSYLAPEQTGRMNRGIDYRSDFYALGVTLYQLLTGTLPFASDDPLELVHCHIAKVAVPVHQVNPEVPAMVSAIVAKLMAKNAEDRYQSALGLKHDLERCLTQWKETGAIAAFELGERDVSDRFLIPEKLYGRESEVKTLLEAFDRVAAGASELMLVAGFSGIGKTAVVNEVHKPIVRQRGYFIRGKYDQFNRNIPLSAFVQALRDLMGQLLSESDRQLQTWKAQILDALGENGQVLIEVIPELEQIIGTQPPPPELSGTAAQNRFNLLFQKFIQVFTTPAHPLVMFLDDLQWADSASLNLIQVLMTESSMGHLLLIGAYRDNEVFAAHPLMLTLDTLRKAQTTVNAIALQPLNQSSLNQLIADTLHCAEPLAQPLTELVMQKTQGNPFFATQFLKTLHQEKLVTFDADAGSWQCDIVRVKDAALTDDVVEFMALQLQKLSEATQTILKLAACIGNQFDLNTLAIVSEQSETEVATALWKALQEGLILPQSDIYKFYVGEINATQNPSPETLSYRFLHDRVQQAAYSLILEDQKQSTHLQIGQLLLANSPVVSDGQIFVIVNQLNHGLMLIKDIEREPIARLNLQAGKKANASTAYQAALGYLQISQQLLDLNAWETQYSLSLEIANQLAFSAYLAGDFEKMQQTIKLVIEKARSLIEQVNVHEIKIQALIVQGKPAAAVKTALSFVEKFGVKFPAKPITPQVLLSLAKTKISLLGKPIQTLENQSKMTDKDKTAITQVLSKTLSATYIAAPDLMPLLVFCNVNLFVKYGNTVQSSFNYSFYALILCGVLQDIEAGYQFGELALKLLTKFDSREVQSRVGFIIHYFIFHWKNDLKKTILPLQESYQVGLETGDTEYAAWAGVTLCINSFYTGKNLDELGSLLKLYIESCVTMNQESAACYSRIFAQTALCLLGQTDTMALEGEIYSLSEKLSQHQENNDKTGLFFVYTNQALLGYLFADFEQARHNLQQARLCEDGGISSPGLVVFYFYDSLACLAQFKQASEKEQRDLLKHLLRNQKKMKLWAHHAPMNYLHKYHLIEAERYRVLDNKIKAIDLYDRAIASAKTNGFIQEEALANELAAKFYLNWGKEKVAAGYMQEAYYCYARWGAKAKTDDLEARYPQLLHPILQAAAQSLNVFETLASIAAPNLSIHTSTHPSTASSTSVNTVLDFAAILKASQSLAGTIQLDELLHQLTQIILQNSGGDRCALILPNHEGQWQVQAIATLEATELCCNPLEGNLTVPVKLIQYVKNTQAMVVMDDLKTDLPVLDEYLTQRRPKSVLCLPIANQGQLIGILYLKNQVTSGAFTSDRLLILNFLCTQAAISLENARLYQDVNQSLQEIYRKETQYRAIFEAVNEGLAITDLETGKLIAANPAYCALHGYSYEDLLEMDPLDLIKPENQFKFLEFLETVRSGQEFTCESICISPHGERFYADIKSVPFSYNGKLCGLSIMRNVTERKQMELAIQQKNQNLEQAMVELQQAQLQTVQSEKMASLGNLVAGVAHEINNPIGFLNGSINNAKDYVKDLLGHLELYQQCHPHPATPVQDNAEDIDLEFLREDLPKLLNSMQGATDRIKNISTSLRTFSRSDTEHKVSANLHEGLDSTLLILKYRLKANEFRPAIEVIQNYSKLPMIECFPGQLNQVFMNILANAIDMFDEMAQTQSFEQLKANPQKITIQTEQRDGQVVIRIRDNGKGMDEATQAKIFDHLFTTKAVGKGTGLGLAIARQIVVQKHEGQLDVWSELGQSTEFCIRLPIAD
jgi:PAS domain S-box-containing protein